ncbi:hypothetical protein BLOT_006359 [Blomia tropicalis]|nr:hypothetical protein BLOT_006359 [Blomia tropicalis]
MIIIIITIPDNYNIYNVPDRVFHSFSTICLSAFLKTEIAHTQSDEIESPIQVEGNKSISELSTNQPTNEPFEMTPIDNVIG